MYKIQYLQNRTTNWKLIHSCIGAIGEGAWGSNLTRNSLPSDFFSLKYVFQQIKNGGDKKNVVQIIILKIISFQSLRFYVFTYVRNTTLTPRGGPRVLQPEPVGEEGAIILVNLLFNCHLCFYLEI